jgi:hypothetical protein
LGSVNKWNGIELKVKKFILHHKYIEWIQKQYLKRVKRTLLANRYDIALIETNKEIVQQFSKTHYSTNGICLPKRAILNNYNELTHFAGWGLTHINNTEPNIKLMKTQFTINSYNNCYSKLVLCSSANSRNSLLSCDVSYY